LQKNRIPVFSLDDEINDNFTFNFSSPQMENMLAAEQSKYIKLAIEKLPQTESLLITLFYMNENSVREIEEITGLSESNIKVKLFRARKILEQELRFLM
jgi:RNA polymerase sigma-70 factor (ECF subfamily)